MSAEQAREAARTDTGQFGTQTHAESGEVDVTFPSGPFGNGFPRRFPPTGPEMIAIIGHPKATVAAALDRGLSYGDPGMNVALSYDHWEAAKFVQDDWDTIARDWHGNKLDLAFLRSFTTHFGHGGTIPDPYERP